MNLKHIMIVFKKEVRDILRCYCYSIMSSNRYC